MTILVHSDWDGLSDHLRDIPWGYFLHLPSLFWSCIYNIHIISIYLYLCVFFISIYLSIYLSIYIYVYVCVCVFVYVCVCVCVSSQKDKREMYLTSCAQVHELL